MANITEPNRALLETLRRRMAEKSPLIQVVIGPENQRWAIEVKAGQTSLTELRGLFEFCKEHSEFEPRLISFTDQKIEGVPSLSAGEILSLTRE